MSHGNHRTISDLTTSPVQFADSHARGVPFGSEWKNQVIPLFRNLWASLVGLQHAMISKTMEQLMMRAYSIAVITIAWSCPLAVCPLLVLWPMNWHDQCMKSYRIWFPAQNGWFTLGCIRPVYRLAGKRKKTSCTGYGWIPVFQSVWKPWLPVHKEAGRLCWLLITAIWWMLIPAFIGIWTLSLGKSPTDRRMAGGNFDHKSTTVGFRTITKMVSSHQRGSLVDAVTGQTPEKNSNTVVFHALVLLCINGRSDILP